MNKLLQVIRKELREIALTKAFIILTITGPILILAVSVLPSLMSQQSMSEMSKNSVVAVTCEDEGEFSTLATAFSYAKITLEKVSDAAKAKKDALDGKFAAVLEIQGTLLNSDPVVFSMINKNNEDLKQSSRGILSRIRPTLIVEKAKSSMAAAGIENPASYFGDFNKDSTFTVFDLRATDGNDAVGESAFMSTILVALGFMMMIYMTALLYGQMIGRSVVLEKTTKTVEVILSSVTPKDLMFGKILGIALAGLIQYGVWAIVGVVLIQFVGPFFHIALPAGLTVMNVIYLVVFFILAFLLYGSLYAALGAASEDEQNLGQMAWPVIIVLMIPMLTFMTFITNPDGIVSVAMSLFPFTAPEVMLMRLLVSPVPIWQMVLCFGILILSIILVGIFAAKIFRIGILMTGKKFKLGEVLGWIAQKE